MLDAQRARQIKKYAGLQCCVCAKWGAAVPFAEPVRGLVCSALEWGLTVKLPDSNAVHEKCLIKLKGMIVHKARIRIV